MVQVSTENTPATPERPSLLEQLYGALVEFSHEACLLVSLEGVIGGWTPAAERLYGYSAQEAIGQNVTPLILAEGHTELMHALAALPQNALVTEIETLCVNKQGRRFATALTVSPLKVAAHEIPQAAVLAREVTEQQRAEKLLQQIIEHSPCGMLLLDETGVIRLVNNQIEIAFGYDRAALLGQAVEMLIPQRFRVAHTTFRRGFQTTPTARSMNAGQDLVGLRRDGSEFAITVGLNPLETAQGPLVLATIIDISAQKAVEQALVEQTEELRRSNAELEQFAYVASHDLQEPLRMVASFTQLLADRYAGRLDERADKYIHYAVEGAQRMQQLVNDLLAYSRIGSQGKKPGPVETAALLQQVLHDLQPVISASGAEIQCAALPKIKADVSQVGQVFQNLLGNALKFRADRPLQIQIDAKPSGDYWRFAVRDNGIGIESAHTERIFQMFQRLHGREQFQGNGIGLAIVKKIIERHGGQVWCESEPGAGTTFYFTLPQFTEETQ